MAELGYCTNVHAGRTWEEMRDNLVEHALPVQQALGGTLGIGLWLSASAARDVVENDRIGEVRGFLSQSNLRAFTFNGFPYGDFHQERVKHDVYQPDWTTDARLEYTKDLVRVMLGLLDPGEEGSISTLPLGWEIDESGRARCGARLDELVSFLEENCTDRLVHVDLEPEPGCALTTCEDVIRFFDQHVPGGSRRFIRVCHDVCHCAVMFEGQAETFQRFTDAGIQVGKVQISSALRLNADENSLAQLSLFDEQRYLHQTSVRGEDGGASFFEDLPDAIAAAPRGEWRVHFHVPIFADGYGALGTTRDEIAPAVKAALAAGVSHFEVETYAWHVLPDGCTDLTLPRTIERELITAASLI